MTRNPYSALLNILGLSIASAQAVARQFLPPPDGADILNMPPIDLGYDGGSEGGRGGHFSNGGGARAHRRWKRARAAGLTPRKRR